MVNTPSITLFYAGLGVRMLALILDSFVLLMLLLITMFIPMFVLGPSPHYGDAFESDLVTIIFLLFVSTVVWFYFAVMESSTKQATLGKMSVGIYVTDVRGKRLTFAKASARFFAKLISCLTIGIGFLIAAFTPNKQALHDRIAGTLVVWAEKDSTKVPAQSINTISIST